MSDPRYGQLIAELVTRIRTEGLRRILIAGAQGSGKSTLAGHLGDALLEAGVTVAVLSVDDFYYTRAEREDLAAKIHPNFAVRGVPGTHDARLLENCLAVLAAGQTCQVPQFNKGDDDRRASKREVGPVDVVILEGWCVGARPEPPERLREPVNDLERNSDPDGRWRRAVNDCLASPEYQQCFASDMFIFLAVPDFAAVFRWRAQQESGLQTGARVMDAAAIRQFIAYYERITAWMLEDVPARADITVYLDQAHRIARIDLGHASSGSIH